MDKKIDKILDLFLDELSWFEGYGGEYNACMRDKLKHTCETIESLKQRLKYILSES